VPPPPVETEFIAAITSVVLLVNVCKTDALVPNLVTENCVGVPARAFYENL